MEECEERHFDADKNVCESKGDVFAVMIWSKSTDGTSGDQDGYDYGLPEGEEEDSLDADELRDRSENIDLQDDE